MDYYTTWIGYGSKWGASLGAFGGEAVIGKVCNLGYTSEVYPFKMTSFRLGPGAGVAAGTVAIVVFNCVNIQSMDGTEIKDWSLNFSLGGKWSDIAKGIRHRKLYRALARIMADLTNASPSDVTTIRNTCSYMYSAVEAEKVLPGTPSAIVLDIPAGGIGIELSWNQLYTVFSVGDLETPISPEESESWTGGGSGSGAGT